MTINYNKTIYACFVGYIVQAIINNFAPILFVTFNTDYNISLKSISLLITINFLVQLIIDYPAVKIVQKFGPRKTIIVSHFLSAAGLISMGILPDIMPTPFSGLVISIILSALGSGIIEVLLSPIVEACPTKNKEGTMSLLHSFYCWGHMLVVLLSTVFFVAFGIANWKILSMLWAIIPIVNGLFFFKLPMPQLNKEENKGLGVRALFKNKLFIIMLLMMFTSGASELAVVQWASAFAEKALGVTKAIGDLAAPLSFALLMGLSRVFFAKFSTKIRLDNFMLLSTILCIISYLMTSLCENPVFSFIGCGLCGLSVGIMWPGALSLGASSIRGRGTALFGLMALAGDLGCSSGPTLVGLISDASGGNFKMGILIATIFPVFLLITLLAKKITKTCSNGACS